MTIYYMGFAAETERMGTDRTMILFSILVCCAVSACSVPKVRAYSGTKLPPEEVSVLVADRSASPSGVSVVIRRVNGIDAVRKGSPTIEVMPGSQLVQVEIVRSGNSSDGLAEARSYTTLTFDTVAGQRYRVQATFEDGLGKAWVIGENDAPISVHSPTIGQ
jgi:predicted RNA-binding protein with TRAM domain